MVWLKPLLLPAVLGVRCTGDGIFLAFHIEAEPRPTSFHGLWHVSGLLAPATLHAFLLGGLLGRLSAALYLWPLFPPGSTLAADTLGQRLLAQPIPLSLLLGNGEVLRYLSNVQCLTDRLPRGFHSPGIQGQ